MHLQMEQRTIVLNDREIAELLSGIPVVGTGADSQSPFLLTLVMKRSKPVRDLPHTFVPLTYIEAALLRHLLQYGAMDADGAAALRQKVDNAMESLRLGA